MEDVQSKTYFSIGFSVGLVFWMYQNRLGKDKATGKINNNNNE